MAKGCPGQFATFQVQSSFPSFQFILTMKDRLVPVHAIGFEDLKKRIAVQKAQTEAQMAGMKVELNVFHR